MKNIIIGIVLFTLTSCGGQESTNTETVSNSPDNLLSLDDKTMKSIAITSENLRTISLFRLIKLNGKIDVPPQNFVSVSCPLGGYIKSTKLLPGMPIKKGEVIAVLEDNQYIQLQQDYLTVKVQLEIAKTEYLRQKELNASKASSDKIYEQTMAAYQSVQISRNALAEKLRLININPERISTNNITRTINLYAPFNGYVSNVLVNIGKYVTPSDVLFELINTKVLHLNIKVFEKDLTNIYIGQQIKAYTNTNPSKIYRGKIILIGKNISDSKTVEVRAELIGHVEELIPGMYMNVEAETTSEERLAVPEEAIVSFEGKSYAFERLDKNKFELIEIQPGMTENGWTALINADKMRGKNMVVKGAYTLLMVLKNKPEE